MVRGSHGVSSGNWYFEVTVLSPPKVSEVVKALPKNVRLGEALKDGLREGMMREREEMREKMMRERKERMEQYKQMQQKIKMQQRQQQQQQQVENNLVGDGVSLSTGNLKNVSTAGAGSTGSDKSNNSNGNSNEELPKPQKKRRLDDTTTATRRNSNNNNNNNNNNNASSETSNTSIHATGGHLRIGWSMRTGELQAPVGYDRWSYAYRNISGSRIHNSQREDKWGGEGFAAGDVIGFAISLVDDSANTTTTTSSDQYCTVANSAFSVGNSTSSSNSGTTTNNAIATTTSNNSTTNNTKTSSSKSNTPQATNHIRFFKNGEGQGHFIVSRGIRTGGAAFDNIPKGMYYPAISPYMGGAARVNFGPHFIHPPRGLPSGMKVRPFSDVCHAPPKPEDVLEMFQKEKVFSKKVDEKLIGLIHEAIKVEAKMRYDCYQKRLESNIEEVRQARAERGLSTSDLPAPVSTVSNGEDKTETS